MTTDMKRLKANFKVGQTVFYYVNGKKLKSTQIKSIDKMRNGELEYTVSGNKVLSEFALRDDKQQQHRKKIYEARMEEKDRQEGIQRKRELVARASRVDSMGRLLPSVQKKTELAYSTGDDVKEKTRKADRLNPKASKRK